MNFLAATQKGNFFYHGANYSLNPLTPPEINPDHILAASSGLENAIIDEHPGIMQAVSFKAESIPGFPQPLQMPPEEIPAGSHIILLRAGGIGDLIMMIPALKEFRRRLSPGCQLTLATYADYAGIFECLTDHLISYPVRLTQLMNKVDYYVEFKDLHDLFETSEMTDFYLDCLGIAPESVPNEAKQPELPASMANAPGIIEAISTIAFKTKVLYAGRASDKIRYLPDAFLSQLAENNPDIAFIIPGNSEVKLDNIFEIDTSGGLHEFITAIAHCDALVSTDSSAYHIAAAFNIPSLVVFGAIDSKIRTTYYPQVVALCAEYRGQTCSSPCGISAIRRRNLLKKPIGQNQVTTLKKGTAIQTFDGRSFKYDPEKGCPESCALDTCISPCLSQITTEKLLSGFTQLLSLKKTKANSRQNLLKPEALCSNQNMSTKLNEAEVFWRQAISSDPVNDQYHVNLGKILAQKGCMTEAAKSYRQAIKINPSDAKNYALLAYALYETGEKDSALSCMRLCLKLDPSQSAYWALFTRIIKFFNFTNYDDASADALMYCMKLDQINKQSLEIPIGSLLSHHPNIKDCRTMIFDRRHKELSSSIIHGQFFEKLNHPLLLDFLEKILMTNPFWEKFLSELRQRMLDIHINHNLSSLVKEQGLNLICALANQCFLNEYIYPVSEIESFWLKNLIESIENDLQNSNQIPEFEIALMAAYSPPSHLKSADILRKISPSNLSQPLADLIIRQIIEPDMELQLQNEIKSLTPIRDHISQSVRAQYEKNPYPRWYDLTHYIPQNFQTLMCSQFLYLSESDFNIPQTPSILIAGCGTGRQAIETALSISNSQVLAIDLSLSSLAYAMRKTRELALSNIKYLQADILELNQLGHDFDIIECGGVLHHLRDPQNGWRILTNLLKPGGYMKIALYSEIARNSVVAAREYIAGMNFQPTIEDIRQCRQEILDLPADSKIKPVTTFIDFYATSECRDLIFHVQEHRFTLPLIETILTELNLEFIGFINLNPTTILQYDKIFPDDPHRTNLNNWNTFELSNTETFKSMYQFWLRKKSN